MKKLNSKARLTAIDKMIEVDRRSVEEHLVVLEARHDLDLRYIEERHRIEEAHAERVRGLLMKVAGLERHTDALMKRTKKGR